VWWERGTKERVRPVEIGVRWDGGAPLPHLLQSEWRTFLAFYMDEPDPTWDGTWVNVVDPTSTNPALIGVIEWLRCTGAVLGGLNDEAFHGHRLWKHGLSKVEGYGAGEVEGSAWIAELERSNRVHEYHRPEAYAKFRHFILAFHDSTFECVAEGFRAFRARDSMPKVLGLLAATIDERSDLPFEMVSSG
jgi:hypothetical protein